MEGKNIKTIFDYVKLLSLVSLFIGIIYQLSHLNYKFGFFSYSNVINDSIQILMLLIITLAAYLMGVKIFTFCFNVLKNEYKDINHFITLLILYCVLYVQYNKDAKYKDPDLINNFIIDVFDTIGIMSFDVLLFLLSFFLLQLNIYHLFFGYYKGTIKFDKLGHIFNILSGLLLIPVMLLVFSEFNFERLKDYGFGLFLLLCIWNYTAKDNYLDYNRLISKNFVYGFIGLLLLGSMLSIGSGENYNHKNVCFQIIENQQIKVEYMNDKYIFTNNGTEIYKNDVNKFFVCKR